jgi:hypothetical protein
MRASALVLVTMTLGFGRGRVPSLVEKEKWRILPGGEV